MKRRAKEDVMMRLIGAAALALTLMADVADAQQPTQSPAQPRMSRGAAGSGQQEHHPSAQGHPCGMMGGGMMGMMGGGRMGGMMGDNPDPRMMQMRGEMMKAMGDIMMKYGKMMEGSPR